jgi:multidrug resistance protein, MATE family
VGQAMGRTAPLEARRAGFTGMALSCAFMCLNGLAFWLLPKLIIGLYLDINDPANSLVVRLATSFLAIAAMFQLFDGLQVSAAGALRGLKDTRVPMLITLIAYWLIGIGSGLWFCFVAQWAGRGLWFGLVLGLATASPLLAWRFHLLTKQTKTSLQQATEVVEVS